MKSIIINKEYAKLLLATFITRFGDSIDTIAFSWLVYVMTGSRVLMGSIFVVSVLPNLIVLPFAGVIADTFNKKTITIIGDILRGLTVASLAILFATNLLEVWHIFVFTIVNSIFESFADPARGSMMQSLVESNDYVKGSSYLGSSSQLGVLVGLAVAGVLISVIGIWGTILIDAFTFFASAILISSMKFKDSRKESLKIQTFKGFFKPIIEGFKYLFTKKILLIVVLLAAFINFLFAPYNILRPVYVDEVLNIGVEGLSFLGIAIFSGMIVGGLVMGKIGKKINPIKAISIGLVMMGLMYMLLGALEFFMLPHTIQIIYSIVVTFLLGFFTPIIQAPISAIVMKATDPEMIGRLSSVISVLALCAMPLGGAMVSFIGDSITVTLLFTIMGLVGVLVSLMFWVKNHKVSVT
jgi:DHA3 family macrolide efflux protein-like MFS transporter